MQQCSILLQCVQFNFLFCCAQESADLPTALQTGDSSSILSEYTYMFVHKMFNVAVVLLYAGIDDLFEVNIFLKQVVNWKHLGLALGLFYPTLQKIESDRRNRVGDCMKEILAAWLQQQDNVSQHGIPSWTVLQTALREIGENELANEINT